MIDGLSVDKLYNEHSTSDEYDELNELDLKEIFKFYDLPSKYIYNIPEIL